MTRRRVVFAVALPPKTVWVMLVEKDGRWGSKACASFVASLDTPVAGSEETTP